jgi:stress response protein YsnF
MTHPSSSGSSEFSASNESVDISTLMKNLNNLKHKLQNFTVLDELGQPIGEIQDLILDSEHQLNLVIAPSNLEGNQPSVLLNGRRIKKVSLQTRAVFVDIVKADVDFLPNHTPLETSDSTKLNNSAPLEAFSDPLQQPLSEQPPSQNEAVAAAALMEDSAIPQSRSPMEITEPSLEDSSTSDPLFDELSEDFASPTETDSIGVFDSLSDDLFSDDEDDLEASLNLPELSEELEFSSLENLSLDSESSLELSPNNALDDWSDLVSPTEQTLSDTTPLVDNTSLPELSSDDVETPSFSLAEQEEVAEIGEFSLWEQADQPIDTLSSDALSNAEIENEFEDLPDLTFAANDFLGDASDEDATEEFLLPTDFGEADSVADLTLESMSDFENPLEEASFLDDFEFTNPAAAELSAGLAEESSLELNLGENLIEPESELSWADQLETDEGAPNELFKLNLEESSTSSQMETESDFESGFVGELAEIALSGIASDTLEPDLSFSGETSASEDSSLQDALLLEGFDDTEIVPENFDLALSLDNFSEGSTSDLDLSLDDFSENAIEPSVFDMDVSISEIPTSFTEVPIALNVSDTSDVFNEITPEETAFDVDLSLEDELGAESFAIAQANISSEPSDDQELSLEFDRVEPEPEIITSLTDLEFNTDALSDTLSIDDLTNPLESNFSSDIDLTVAEDEENFENLSGLDSELEARDVALDRLFATPADYLENNTLTNADDEFDFSTPGMGFVDPAAGMAAAGGILAGLAGGAAINRSSPIAEEASFDRELLENEPLEFEETISDEAVLNLDEPTSLFLSDSIAPSDDLSDLSIPTDSVPTLASLDDMVPLLEERLQVEYEQRKVGEVVIRKKIETRMIQVPVRYEVLVIEQVNPEQKTLAEVDLSQGTFSETEMPMVQGQPIVSGEFKSPKTASAVLDAIAKTLRDQCKSIRIEVELADGNLVQSYQDWLDRCSDV